MLYYSSAFSGENMEESLGMSDGAELSTEDVSVLFCKVFHMSCSRDEAEGAMKKIEGDANGWSCAGANVLDVLCEIEREKERKEMLYWDCQLLNSGNLHHILQNMLQRKDSEFLIKSYNPESGLSQPKTAEVDIFQSEKILEKKLVCSTARSMKRLQKAAKQCWARLASEGVHSILPAPWCKQRLGLRGQAWASVTLSDVLSLVEVKYDVVTHFLYREMLQEHHTQVLWEMLLPWQQRKEVEALETIAEEALQSADMLGLAFLPGAFRIYKASCSGSSWSAVALLNNLHTACEQEKQELTVMGQRLCKKSLRLLCLHILLAIYRVQREKTSYSALLASRQSWVSWPQVLNPFRAEQVTLLLQNEDKLEDKALEDFETIQQRTELQLLVLTQEKERKHLLKLVQRISLEDLQESDCTIPPKDSNAVDAQQTSLRAGCIKRLKQIDAELQRQNGSDNNSKNISIQIKMQGKWCQTQLADCILQLLMHLIALQDIQALALLQVLLHRDLQASQALREKYEAEIKTQHFSNLLHLLTSDDPQTIGSILAESINNERTGPESSHKAEAENICLESVPATTKDPINRASGECVEVPTAGSSAKQEVCSGCGVIMKELPYVEILSVPDAHANALALESRACEKEEEHVTDEAKSLESVEKQGSLIPLAWSKPQDDSEDIKSEDGDGGTEKYQDILSSEEMICERDSKELASNQNPIQDQPGEGEATPEIDLHSLEENLHDARLRVPRDSFECSADEASSHTDGACREMSESELWELRGSQLSDREELIPSQHSTQIGSSPSGRTTMLETNELAREDVMRDEVSAVERERTMRNLVDMQRKFEERHQRDKERQMFRVQERLSIILNRKAEEDLLGLKHTDRLKHLTQDLPLEDKSQQKTVVRERLEQLRRERSYIMQSKRDRNTSGFKELLAPVALYSSETDDVSN